MRGEKLISHLNCNDRMLAKKRIKKCWGRGREKESVEGKENSREKNAV